MDQAFGSVIIQVWMPDGHACSLAMAISIPYVSIYM